MEHKKKQNYIPISSLQKPLKLNYPTDICRFDDDFSGNNIFPVRDSKILKKLKQKCAEAKILWEATDQKSFFNLEGVFDPGDEPPFSVSVHQKQFLVYLHMAVSYAKLLTFEGRLSRHRALLMDRNAIYALYIDSFYKAKFCIERYIYAFSINFSHPFTELVLKYSPNDALLAIQSSNYKTGEALFIRTSKAERKLIVDTVEENLIDHRNIVIYRLQISTKFTFPPRAQIGSDDFKSELSILLDRIGSISKNNLLCAMHSLFPSALSQFGLLGFNGTIGHLVLLFSKNAFKQNELLSFDLEKSFLLNDGTSIQTRVVDSTLKGYMNIGIGNMATSASRQGLEQLADYMTIERRYLKPGFRFSSVLSLAPCLKKQHTLFVKQFK